MSFANILYNENRNFCSVFHPVNERNTTKYDTADLNSCKNEQDSLSEWLNLQFECKWITAK